MTVLHAQQATPRERKTKKKSTYSEMNGCSDSTVHILDKVNIAEDRDSPSPASASSASAEDQQQRQQHQQEFLKDHVSNGGSGKLRPLLHPIPMALMPLSQAAAWYLVLQRPTDELYANISRIAAFYCGWALYKKYVSGEKELGHISMGFLSAMCHLQHRKLCIAATVLVLANFGLAAFFVLVAWSPARLAKVVKKSTSQRAIVWAYIFKLYFFSSIYFWSVVLKKFLRKFEDGPVPEDAVLYDTSR